MERGKNDERITKVLNKEAMTFPSYLRLDLHIVDYFSLAFPSHVYSVLESLVSETWKAIDEEVSYHCQHVAAVLKIFFCYYGFP